MAGRMEGRVALVTGGGSGIGRGIARAFLREGARVMISGRREATLKEALLDEPDYAERSDCVAGDVSVDRDARMMVEAAVRRFGRLDVLVNNAGVRASIGTILDLSEAEWDATFAIDAKGSWLCSRHAIPRMREAGGGSIIMVNSISSLVGQPQQGCYNAAKAAQLALMRCMALDFAADRIRVNAICPAWVRTEMNEEQLAAMRSDPDRQFPPGISYRDLLVMHPVGRVGTPEDVAGMAVYLGSDESAWVTGSAMMVDGGYTCR